MKIIFSESSNLNNSVYGNCQAPIKMFLEKRGEEFEQNSVLKNLFLTGSSKNYGDVMTTLTAMSGFEPVGENGAYPKTSMREGYSKTIEPATWKSSFEVTQEMVEDAKHGKIKSRAGIFTTSYGRTREKFAAALLAGATGKTVPIGRSVYDATSADGVPLFSTAHPSITGGAAGQSNLFTGAFSAKVLDTVQERMQDFTDDDGNLLNLAPDTIIIPNIGSLKRAVFAAVGSEQDPESNSNALNFQMGLWNVIVWPYLPKTIGDKPYFMLMDSRFKEDYLCLPFVERTPLTVKSDIDPNTDANIWRGRARFAAGFNNWRCIALCGEGVSGTSVTA